MSTPNGVGLDLKEKRENQPSSLFKVSSDYSEIKLHTHPPLMEQVWIYK
jgi:hypothetical protein